LGCYYDCILIIQATELVFWVTTWRQVFFLLTAVEGIRPGSNLLWGEARKRKVWC